MRARPSTCCALGQTLMRDPVTAADGHTYERAVLQQCIDYARESEWAIMISSFCSHRQAMVRQS